VTRPQADLSKKGDLVIAMLQGQPYPVQIGVVARAFLPGLRGEAAG
jgi:hypothetical protein